MTSRPPRGNIEPDGPPRWNFSTGPGALRVPVLEHVRDELLAHSHTGASVLELSHRSSAFEALIDEAERNLRELLDVPDSDRILFLQGGASLQFSMVPMNLLRAAGAPAAYVRTGSWSTKALVEAREEGEAIVAWDGAPSGFTRVPDTLVGLAPGAAYLHVTSNETVEGVELSSGFEPPDGPPLVCDASSDLFSRPIPVE